MAADTPDFSLDGDSRQEKFHGAGDKGGSGVDDVYRDMSILKPTRQPKRSRRRIQRPWYKPRLAVGFGLHFPDLIPIEVLGSFGRYLALRGFYSPPVPFNIRVEMPTDVISTKKGVGVANPDFTVRFKAHYGSSYGFESLAFPFGGSFFLGAGVSAQLVNLTGAASSPVLVCSVTEAAKEPPCGDKAARIETESKLKISADATMHTLLARLSLGWLWFIGDTGYLKINGGYIRPFQHTRGVRVDADIDSPTGSSSEVGGALAQIKLERQADLATKAKEGLGPIGKQPLPSIGLTFGWRL